jgi:hypothetical protein
MRLGFIPQSAWAHLEKDKNLVETIWASRVAYAKPLKCNRVKEMDAISKYHDSKIIHGQYISILIYIFKNIICILTLECNIYFCFLVLGFGAQ